MAHTGGALLPRADQSAARFAAAAAADPLSGAILGSPPALHAQLAHPDHHRPGTRTSLAP